MNDKIIIWGATGQAKVLRECIGHTDSEIVALFDKDPRVKSPFRDIPIHHGNKGFIQWWENAGKSMKKIFCLVAIGGDNGRDRVKIQNFLGRFGISPYRAIHPSAFVAENASIGKGAQILANAAVCVNARLGTASIINTGATLDHDSKIGRGSHLAPGCHVAGEVTIRRYTMIGIGSVVLPRITIGENVIVAAGSVVTKDIPDNVVVGGTPVRLIKNRNQ